MMVIFFVYFFRFYKYGLQHFLDFSQKNSIFHPGVCNSLTQHRVCVLGLKRKISIVKKKFHGLIEPFCCHIK